MLILVSILLYILEVNVDIVSMSKVDIIATDKISTSLLKFKLQKKNAEFDNLLINKVFDFTSLFLLLI
jgi:hypothetical protein